MLNIKKIKNRIKLFFKKKYYIRYVIKMNNPPYNDVYFCIGDLKNKGTIKEKAPDKDYEMEQLWSKKERIKELKKKEFLFKEDIINACCFEKQKKYMNINLK